MHETEGLTGISVVIAVTLFLLCLHKCMKAIERRDDQSRLQRNVRTPFRAPSSTEHKENRLSLILDGVIHKKALACKDGDKPLLLPHEEELSSRALEELEYMSDVENNVDADGKAVETSSKENVRRQKAFKDDIFVKMMSSPSLRMSSSSISFYSPKTCAICLETYKENDDICWSHNKNCAHAFHFHCMLGWLMDNDDCPLCREDYLKNTTTECNIGD